jgi:hypothetical protein
MRETSVMMSGRMKQYYGTTAQYGGTSGGAFSAGCILQIPLFAASEPA